MKNTDEIRNELMNIDVLMKTNLLLNQLGINEENTIYSSSHLFIYDSLLEWQNQSFEKGKLEGVQMSTLALENVLKELGFTRS